MTDPRPRDGGRSGLSGLVSVAWVVVFALKLAGVIGWSWWLVFAPLWGPALVALPFVLVALMSIGTERLGERVAEWRIRRRHAGDNPELWL